MTGALASGALPRLIDKDQIIDLIHRYSYLVDHRRYDEVVELLTEDCVIDYGPGVDHRSTGSLQRFDIAFAESPSP